MGSGSTGIVALKHDRDFWGCELDEKFYKDAEKRLNLANNSRQISLF